MPTPSPGPCMCRTGPGSFNNRFRVQAFAIEGKDPSLWRTQANPETPGMPGDRARFWPPRLGAGEVGITYFMVDDARAIFLPTLRADYPGGTVRTTHPPQCAATGFVLTEAIRSRRRRSTSTPWGRLLWEGLRYLSWGGRAGNDQE